MCGQGNKEVYRPLLHPAAPIRSIPTTIISTRPHAALHICWYSIGAFIFSQEKQQDKRPAFLVAAMTEMWFASCSTTFVPESFPLAQIRHAMDARIA